MRPTSCDCEQLFGFVYDLNVLFVSHNTYVSQLTINCLLDCCVVYLVISFLCVSYFYGCTNINVYQLYHTCATYFHNSKQYKSSSQNARVDNSIQFSLRHLNDDRLPNSVALLKEFVKLNYVHLHVDDFAILRIWRPFLVVGVLDLEGDLHEGLAHVALDVRRGRHYKTDPVTTTREKPRREKALGTTEGDKGRRTDLRSARRNF